MTVALYRTYRSQTFAELIGQPHLATTLRNEVLSNKVAHAYLFTGVRGTGKTSTARILARAVNCLDSQGGEPCNQCAACKEILSGAAVDILEIDAASNRGIDEMRDLREKVKFLPASLKRKVYIIDEAHMLTNEAWNAFLKTLEEPPDHVLFVLCTTDPQKIPETVRSRVQRFDLRRVDEELIAQHLAKVSKAEGMKITPDAVALIAQAASGSMRDALSLLEQLRTTEDTIDGAGVRAALGLASPEVIASLMLGIAAVDGAAAIRALDAAFAAGQDPRVLLREVSRLARWSLRLSLGGSADGVPELDLIRELAKAPGQLWLRVAELCAEGEIRLRQQVDARLVVELCVLKATTKEVSAPPVSHPVIETKTETKTEPVIEKNQAIKSGSAPKEEWQVKWASLIDAINKRDPMLSGVLRGFEPGETEGGSLRITTKHKFHYDKVNDPAKIAVIAEVASEQFGYDLPVEIIYVERPAEAAGKPSEMNPTEAVLNTFKGSKIVGTHLHDTNDDSTRSN